MKRRHFLAASVLLAAPASFAQGVRRIGFLGSVVPTTETRRDSVDHLWQALRERGWEAGRNLSVIEHWAEGEVERLPGLAVELVATRPDLIVVGLLDAALALQKATATIPIVTVLPFDPVRHGLIASYARPGGNITGLSYEAGAIGDKQLDLLRQTVPGLARVAVLWNPDVGTQALWLKDMQPASRSLRLELRPVPARSPKDFNAAFERMKQEGAGALLVLPDVMMFQHRERIAGLAARHRLPSISVLLDYPQLGGLMGYVVDIADSYRRAASYVDRILRGARPAELPVEQPTKFILTLNRKVARILGLKLPPAMLARADRVIE